MKTMRNLFLLCAGLSLFACSSDDDATQQFPEGTGAVTVKIANPSTRAISGASTSQVVNGDITLTVVHSNGTSTATLKYVGGTYTDEVVDDSYTDLGDVTANGDDLTYTFYGIGTPSLVSASMYGGVASYDDVAIIGGTPELQVTPNQIPVYGEIKSFGTGAAIKKNDVTYRQYTAAVTMTIPVARIEVNVEVGDMSTFKSVKLLGVYLDEIKPTGAGAVTNYYLEGDESETKQATTTDPVASAYAILSDSYTGSPITLTDGVFLPADVDSKKQYFAYNFYAGTNPEFKLLLQVEQKDGQAEIPAYQYAILKDFSTTFANQNIYQVNVVLNDENIQIDEEGGAIEYALTATVTKASWTAVSVTGQWGQGDTENQL